MKKVLTLWVLLMAFAVVSVHAEEETYAGTKYVWTFDNLEGTGVTTSPTTVGDALVLCPSSSFKVAAAELSGTFSDGTEWTASKYLELTGRTSISETDFSSRRLAASAKNGTFKDYIAFNTTVPGTCYVIYYRKGSATDGRNLSIWFQDETNAVLSSSNQVTGYQVTEEKLTASAAGTFFIQAGQTVRVYAVMFVPETTVSVTDAGYATFTNVYDFNLSLPEGLTAYAASSTTSDKVQFTAVDVLEAGKGYLLKADAGDYKLSYSDTQSEYTGVNYMTAVANDTEVLGDGEGCTNYILGTVNGVTGFYKSSGGTMTAGKSYLSIPSSSAAAKSASLSISFGDVTGINSQTMHSEANTAAYNLFGCKVGKDYKGIIVKDGKKYLNK